MSEKKEYMFPINNVSQSCGLFVPKDTDIAFETRRIVTENWAIKSALGMAREDVPWFTWGIYEAAKDTKYYKDSEKKEKGTLKKGTVFVVVTGIDCFVSQFAAGCSEAFDGEWIPFDNVDYKDGPSSYTKDYDKYPPESLMWPDTEVGEDIPNYLANALKELHKRTGFPIINLEKEFLAKEQPSAEAINKCLTKQLGKYYFQSPDDFLKAKRKPDVSRIEYIGPIIWIIRIYNNITEFKLWMSNDGIDEYMYAYDNKAKKWVYTEPNLALSLQHQIRDGRSKENYFFDI